MVVEPLVESPEVILGNPQSLTEVTHCATDSIGRNHPGEHGALVAPALMDPENQLGADFAWKIEVDVRRCQFFSISRFGKEPVEPQAELEGVDVRKTGEVADEQGHR